MLLGRWQTRWCNYGLMGSAAASRCFASSDFSLLASMSAVSRSPAAPMQGEYLQPSTNRHNIEKMCALA